MRSKKHLILIAATLLLGAFVATAKPPRGGWKGENPCQGFFEGPFLFAQEHGNATASEGKLCFWEGNTSTVHAKVEIEPAPVNETWCIYLADAFDLYELLNGTAVDPALLGTDADQDDEVHFDEDICLGGCDSAGLGGEWFQPAFWVTALDTEKVCGSFDNETFFALTGFALPGNTTILD